MGCIIILLFCFTTCFTVVQLIKYDRQEKIQFLKERRIEMDCWQNRNVLSRKVTFKGTKTSINDFFMVSTADLLEEWPINKYNVNDLSLLMNTVLSCEYSESNYKIFEYVNLYLSVCETNYRDYNNAKDNTKDKDILRKSFVIYQSCIYIVFLELKKTFVSYVMRMMFTLVGFIKNGINFESSTQDMFKILLSLYLNMKNYESIQFFDIVIEGQENIIPEMDTIVSGYMQNIISISSQIQTFLTQFNIQYCRSRAEFKEFTTNISDDAKAFTKLQDEIIKLKGYVSFDYMKHVTVINEQSSHISLLNILLLNTNITVNWNNNSLALDTIYSSYINNSPNIQTILQYEYFIIRIMSKLVYAKLVNELRLILEEGYDSSRYGSISSIFDSFLSKLKPSNHSILFVNQMKELKYRLSSVILNLESTDTKVLAMEFLNNMESASKVDFEFSRKWGLRMPNENSVPILGEFNTTDYVKIHSLEDFLNNFILNKVNDTYLHYEITNIFYSTSNLIMSGPFEYLFNYKIIHTSWIHTSRNLIQGTICSKLYRNSLYEANESVIDNLEQCKREVIKSMESQNNNDIDMKNRFDELRNKLMRLLELVVDYLRKNYATDLVDYQIRKLFLTFLNNVRYVKLYEESMQLIINDELFDSLISFHSIFFELIIRSQLVICDASHNRMSFEPKSVIDPILNKENTEMLQCINENTMPLCFPPSIVGCSSIIQSDIDILQKCSGFILQNNTDFDGTKIKFYVNGNQKNVLDIITEFESRPTVDFQDFIERQYRTVKWIFCWLYRMFINILNAMIHNGVAHSMIRDTCILDKLNYLLSLDVDYFTSRPIIFIITSFRDVIKLGGRQVELENLKTLIIEELNIFGVVLTSLPRVIAPSVSQYVKIVCSSIATLQEKEDFSELIKTVGLKRLLTGKPNLHGKLEEKFTILVKNNI